MSVCEAVKHYQRSIERCNGDEERILHCISKLYRLPVSVQHLEDTGIGRTVNSLRKFEGNVARASKELISKWKAMVAEEASSESEDEQDEGDSEAGSDAASEEPSSDEAAHTPVQIPIVEIKKEKETPKLNSPEKTSIKVEVKEEAGSRTNIRDNKNISEASHSHSSEKVVESNTSSHRSHKRHRDENSSEHKSSKKHKHDSNDSNKKNHTGSSGSDREKESHRSHHKHKSSSSKKDRHSTVESNSVKALENNGDVQSKQIKSEKQEEKHSSSKSKHKSKSHDSKKRDEKRSSSNSSSKEHKEHKDKRKTTEFENGIGSHSGPSFEEALGFATVKSPKKKSSSQSSASTSKAVKSPSSLETPKLLSPTLQLAPLNIELPVIPTVSPNYRPLPYVDDSRQAKISLHNAVGLAISSKNQRTKVYSGNKGSLTHVPTLYEMCIRLLQENIDAVEYTGGVPYDILRPILERATPEQLFTLEHHNPYLIEDSDLLWEFHCKKKFRGKPRMEMEGWREMYLRCQDEQEAKLRSITANIKESQDKSQPVRKAKMAYFDSAVKPPRNIAKKQAQFGTARIPVVTPAARVSALSGINSNIAKAGDSRLKIRAGAPDNAQATTSHKHKRAPLMMKTLSFMKGRFKR